MPHRGKKNHARPSTRPRALAHICVGKDAREKTNTLFLTSLLGACALLTTTLTLSTGTAQAANGHGLTKTFGSQTSEVKDPEPLSAPAGIAWSASTNEIYVIDAGHERVVRFSSGGTSEGVFEAPAGGFSAPNAIAVDNDPSSKSYGDVYVSDASHKVIDKFEPEGKYLNQMTGTSGHSFEAINGVMVTPSGDVWVYETEESETAYVDEFDDSTQNVYVSRPAGEIMANPRSVAIDSQGSLYTVLDEFGIGVFKFPWNGHEYEGPESGDGGCDCVTGVAVQPSTNNLYVDHGTSILEYGPFGMPFAQPVDEFGASALKGGAGLAATATGTVYVADSTTNEIDEFQEGPKPEQPTAEKTGPVEGTSATLEGKLAGGESAYHFAYDTGDETCKGGKTTPTVAATGSESVSTEVTGLVAKTQYTFCLIAEDTYGPEPGAPVTFTTKSATPVIEQTSSSVNRVEAALEGTVNPEREAATCVFQYGTSETYGQEAKCAPEALGEAGVGVSVTATLEGLVPDTTYDYRLLATNGTGTQPGANGTFTTEVITPTHVETAPASNLTPSTAQLGGQANPGGSATYYIEYGTPTCSLNGVPNFAWWLCATKTAEAGPIRGDSTQAVAPIEVTGLTPGSTYRYWIVAHNPNGSERGEEALFTTPAVSSPAAAGSTPTPAPVVVPVPKTLVPPPPPKRTIVTRAQKLAKALHACKKKPKRSRASCEKAARHTFSPTKKPRTSKKKGSH